MAMKQNGKSIVSSDYDDKVMFFKDVSLGHHESQLRFRLIHFWEAWNPIKKTLIGLEMLLIDEQGTIIQGFISPGRIEKYLPEMKRGSVYKLNNFYGSINKSVFRVCDHTATVSFSWNSELSVLLDCQTPFDEDSFRFHSYEEFQSSCYLKGDLYDVVGHMKLVNGQSIIEARVLDEVEIEKARYSCPHLNVLLACIYGLRCPTYYRLLRLLCSNPAIAEQVNAEVVTKREAMTIGEIFSYIKQEFAKDAFFECTATIDDVVHGSTWYYIACSGCHTKVTKDPTSMICTNSKCGKVNVARVAQYQLMTTVTKLSLYYLVMLVANGNQECNHEAPVPEALISTIGQRHKFCVKVTEHNLSGKTRSLTVTKILPLDAPAATVSSEEDHTTATSEKTFKSRLGSAEGSKRTCDSDEIEEAKRFKRGN
ncbi:hypothetical protein F2Q70_00012684 [Brassica cretica]|uniref:Replication factor A C-terminal domain-containing protein n=1 Tax=Brassica cretica TaxID=69181 RepID=A0A3N6TV55_BRACR|nr:hypothetical protein F2Q70_00012684 [Brassica cretica]KAF3543666.1 hypothetical protein DY000_02008892 [Brassica cretica]